MFSQFSETYGAHFSDLLRKVARSLHAKLVCNRDGEIVYRNEMSQSLLAAKDGLIEINGRLSSLHDVDTRNLRRAISDVMEIRKSDGVDYVALTLNRGFDGGFLEVLIEPVLPPSSQVRLNDPDRILAIVTAAIRPHCVTTRDDVLRDLYRLTQAEARVVGALVNGCSLTQIAEELKVSKNTIRSQLQSIFSKTGTSRQSALVNLILTGVAVEHRPARGAGNQPDEPGPTSDFP